MNATAEFSSIEDLQRVIDRVLWILLKSRSDGQDYVTADELAKRLTEVHKIATSKDAVRKALERAQKGLVHVKRFGRSRTYAIMKKGETYLAGLGKPRVVLIDPEKAYTSRRRAEEILQGFTGLLRICDPYVDPATLHPLTAIKGLKSGF